MATLDELVVELKAKTDNIEAGIKRIDQKFGRFSSQVQENSTKVQRQFSDMGRAAQNLGAALGVSLSVAGMIQFAKAATDVKFRIDAIANALHAATGSTQAAKNEYAFLSAVTERLGINTLDAAGAYARLLAAASGTSLEGQKTRDSFIAISEAAAVLRLSAEDTAGVIRAFEQIISKGVVSSEELKLQLGDRLPGAMKIAASAMDVSVAKFQEMLKNGEVLSEDFIPKFTKRLREEFAPGVEAAANSAQAGVARLQNAFERLMGVVGASITNSDMFANAVNGWAQAFDWLARKIAVATDNLAALSAQAVNTELGNTIAKIQELNAEMNDIRSGGDIQKGDIFGFDFKDNLIKSREVQVERLKERHKELLDLLGEFSKHGDKEGAAMPPISPKLSKEAEKAIKNAEKLQDSLDELQRQTSRDVYTHGMTELEDKLAKVDFMVADLARRYEHDLTPAQKRQIETVKDNVTELDRLQKEEERHKRLMEDLGGAFSGAFEEGVLGAENFGDVLGALGNQIEKILFRQIVTNPFNDLISGIDFGSIFGSSSNKSKSSSSGGGILAELGDMLSFDVGANRIPNDMVAKIHKDEMIVPAFEANKIRNGQMALGHGGGDVKINIINNSSAKIRAESTQNSAGGTDIRVMVDEMMASNIGSRGTKTSQALLAFNQQSLVRR